MQSDIGFATWKEQDDGIYIVEIFVNPDKRQKRVASTLADQCIDQAKEMGVEVKSVYGSVSMLSNTSHLSLMALTLWGMKLHKSREKQIKIFLNFKLNNGFIVC